MFKMVLKFMCTLWTATKRLFKIYKRNFSRSRVCGWGKFLHYPFADLAVFSSAYASEKKCIIYN